METPHPSLPIVEAPPPVRAARPWRAAGVHACRVVLLVAIVLLIHRSHQLRTIAAAAAPAADPPLELVQETFPAAFGFERDETGETIVVDAAGARLGTIVQTSPQSDRIIGFSGPTNVLLVFDTNERLLALHLLSSRDTREHVAQVEADPRFLPSYPGLTRSELAARTQVDGVSGATLTSLAIAESITHRLGGAVRSLRFPEAITVEEVRPLFADAAAVEQDEQRPSLWRVCNAAGVRIGWVLRGSPAVDNLIGYQGPTDLLLGLEGDDGSDPLASPRVLGIVVGRSFDNEPYVSYVREDGYFFEAFAGRTLYELSELDLRAEGVEGVSGATMTSLTVAEGLVVAARRQLEDEARLVAAKEAARFRIAPRDWGTAAITLLGTIIGLSSWRGRGWVRYPLLVGLVGYLGFVNADFVSQALLVGWARNGVPWRTMSGPLLLVAAALLIPVVARQNVYCSHLCPHGAAQQLLMRRLPWQVRLGPRLHRWLTLVPGLLLVWVTIVAVTGSAFSLVDIEPFDAYVPLIAGVPALVLCAGGLLASLVTPMAYCQYGCPTGALLGWLRRHGRSDRIGAGDVVALLCLAAAIILR